jgi:hypothetical protein
VEDASLVTLFVVGIVGLLIQYLVITLAVRHGVVAAQRVLDKQDRRERRVDVDAVMREGQAGRHAGAAVAHGPYPGPQPQS